MKKEKRPEKKYIIKVLLAEAWFRIKAIGVFKDTAVHGHSVAWDMFKRRLLIVWQNESSTG